MDDGLERRLVRVMFTGLAAYTALLQADARSAVEQRDLYGEATEVATRGCA